MQKYLKLTVTLTLAIALLAVGSLSCAQEEETINEGDTYTVGAVFSVTGPYSPLGEPEKQTVEMMVDEVNAAGGINGHPLEVILYDDESDSTKAQTMATRLVEQDEVLAMIGTSGSGPCTFMEPVATDNKVPMVACAASEPIVNDEEGNEREWTFMTPQSSNQAARAIYNYLANTLNMNNVALLTDKGGFGVMGLDAFEAEAPGYDITIVAKESFDNVNDIDMTPQLDNLMAESPDAIICWGTNPGPAIITTNWDVKYRDDVLLFQSHGSLSNTFLNLAGDAAEGVIFPSGKFWIADQLPDSDPQKAVLLNHIADFEALYGEGKANTFGGHAADALNMVIDALDTMENGLTISEARTHIRDNIQNITGWVGTGGIYNMSPDNHHGLTDASLIMIQVVDGKWTWLK
jgi:branched-chain amino acid transport system substrate-binding protein